jgi:hypothetical protein
MVVIILPWIKRQDSELKKCKKILSKLSSNRLKLSEKIIKLLPYIVPYFLGSPGPLGRAPLDILASLREILSTSKTKKSFIQDIKELIKIAGEIEHCLDKKELEEELNKIAGEWGLSVEEFKNLIKNIKSIKKLDLGKMLKNLEEKIEDLEIKALGGQVGIVLSSKTELEEGVAYPNFKVKNGVPIIQKVIGKEKEEEIIVVRRGRFEELAKSILNRLTESRFVVLEGPKGTGKSTLAIYTAWLALLRGLANYIIRIDPREIKNINIYGIRNLLDPIKRIKNREVEFLLLYDPSPIEAYTSFFEVQIIPGQEIDHEEIIQALLRLVKIEKRIKVIVVLPRDIYMKLSEDFKIENRIKDHTIEVSLKEIEFLEEIIKTYSNCKGDFRKLAGMISKMKGGYTLVASYAGYIIREEGCKEIESVEEILKTSKEEPKVFMAHYLWRILLNKNEDLAKKVAVPLCLHALVGPIPRGITYITKAVRDGGWRFLTGEEIKKFGLKDLEEKEIKPIAQWLSFQHEDLVEEMLEDICFGEEHVKKQYKELKDLIDALDWARSTVLSKEGTLSGFVTRRLIPVLEKTPPDCWRRLAYMLGTAPLGHRYIPKPSERYTIPYEALNPCSELDDYLLVNSNKIALLSMGPLLMYVPAYLLNKYQDALKELRDIVNTWRDHGGYNPIEAIYAFGLSRIIINAVNKGVLRDLDPQDAEIVLTAISVTPDVTVSKELIKNILLTSIPLLDHAPHYFVLLLRTISEHGGLDKETIGGLHRALNVVLGRKYLSKLEKDAWPLVEAIRASTNLLTKHYYHLDEQKIALLIEKVLDMHSKLKGQLRILASLDVLSILLKLGHGHIQYRGKEFVKIDIEELLKKLEDMEKMEPEEQTIKWLKVTWFRPVVESFKYMVRHRRALFKYYLAHQLLMNDQLDKARDYFERAAKLCAEINDWLNYIVSYRDALKCSVLSARSLSEIGEMIREFENLWRITVDHMVVSAYFLELASRVLAEYLVCLAINNRRDDIIRILENWNWLFKYSLERSVLFRLLFNYLGIHVVERPSDREIENALSEEVSDWYNSNRGLIEKALSGDKNDIESLKSSIKDILNKWVKYQLEKGPLQSSEEREAVNQFHEELLSFIDKQSISDVVELLKPRTSSARLILMLRALVKNDEELARAHAKISLLSYSERLHFRLFYEATKASNSKEFKLAVLKLFYLHI